MMTQCSKYYSGLHTLSGATSARGAQHFSAKLIAVVRVRPLLVKACVLALCCCAQLPVATQQTKQVSKRKSFKEQARSKPLN
jgi:hypothetical protein